MLAWVDGAAHESCAGAYLEVIRVIVVDRHGARRPMLGDPIEEATCKELAALVPLAAGLVEEALDRLSDLEHDIERIGTPEHVETEAAYLRLREEFERFLELRDLGDGRLVVAFGGQASFPEDYDTLRQTLQRKDDL
jgi:hypothetical protein